MTVPGPGANRPGEPTGERPSQRTLAIVPTYNERENLPLIVERVHRARPDVHILIVDDGSPDGTGELANDLALADPDRVHVMHRTAKAGLGAAYMAGFAWALERDYTVIVEMDADGSHAPEQLHRLLDALTARHADLVLGSRYVPGGRVVNWPRHRLWLSRGGSLYSRLALGIGIRDITGGYRAFRREVLEKLTADDVASAGYCFQVDMLWRTIQAGYVVTEVPITFAERERGQSKMSGNIVREALMRVTQWGVRHRLDQLRALFGGKPA
jgi:dolichol-phosphate mannosyltransferase